MHELPVVEHILSIALKEAEEAGASRIKSVEITIGRLSGIIPECVQFHWDIISRKTMAAGAKLIFNRPPARIYCRPCNKIFEASGLEDLSCPDCKEKKIGFLSGREKTVDMITME